MHHEWQIKTMTVASAASYSNIMDSLCKRVQTEHSSFMRPIEFNDMLLFGRIEPQLNRTKKKTLNQTKPDET